MRSKLNYSKAETDFKPLQLYRFPFALMNFSIIVLFFIIYSSVILGMRVPGGLGAVMGIPGYYLSTVLYIRYMFVVVEYTSLGYNELPKLSGAMIFPANDDRLWKEVLLVILLLLGYHEMLILGWQTIYSVVALIVFPLATAIITIEHSFSGALSPKVWLHMIRSIDLSVHLITYVVLQSITIIVISNFVTDFYDIYPLTQTAQLFVILVLLMLMFRSLGIVLHASADKLGISTKFSAEAAKANADQVEQQIVEDLMSRLHKLSATENYKDAWQLLSDHLQKDNYTSLSSVFDRLKNLQDPYLSLKLGQEYIERLVLKNNISEAWRVFDYCHLTPGIDFYLRSGNSVLKLAETADSEDQYRAIEQLLACFETEFPNHPRAAEALLIQARIHCNQLNDFHQARTILLDLESRFPEIAQFKAYRETRALLEKAGQS